MKRKGKVAGKTMEEYLVVPPPPTVRLVIPAKERAGVIKALDDIRALFGKNGQNWITGEEHEHYEAGDYYPKTGEVLRKAFDGYCLIGGVYAVDGRYENAARLAIAMAITERTGALNVFGDDVDEVKGVLTDEDTIINFNDDNADWSAIKAVLARAKVLVRKADVR